MPAQRRATKAESAAESAAKAGPRVLKKYPNRRLYDTQTSSYITLADVKKMVLDGLPFEVLDAKTSEDLTRSILLQIILEEESGGLPMFSTQTLSQMIRFYGHTMQGMMGSVLEKNMQAFADMQARVMEQNKSLGEASAFTPEAWAQLMSGQAPMMQNLMGSYLEQSKTMFEKMQEQMAASSSLFGGLPGFAPGKK
jgi:polyhydroxyalkanoate synthesis repressor PhaR